MGGRSKKEQLELVIGTAPPRNASAQEEKKFQCDKCPARFATKSNMHRHVRTLHGNVSGPQQKVESVNSTMRSRKNSYDIALIIEKYSEFSLRQKRDENEQSKPTLKKSSPIMMKKRANSKYEKRPKKEKRLKEVDVADSENSEEEIGTLKLRKRAISAYEAQPEKEKRLKEVDVADSENSEEEIGLPKLRKRAISAYEKRPKKEKRLKEVDVADSENSEEEIGSLKLRKRAISTYEAQPAKEKRMKEVNVGDLEKSEEIIGSRRRKSILKNNAPPKVDRATKKRVSFYLDSFALVGNNSIKSIPISISYGTEEQSSAMVATSNIATNENSQIPSALPKDKALGYNNSYKYKKVLEQRTELERVKQEKTKENEKNAILENYLSTEKAKVELLESKLNESEAMEREEMRKFNLALEKERSKRNENNDELKDRANEIARLNRRIGDLEKDLKDSNDKNITLDRELEGTEVVETKYKGIFARKTAEISKLNERNKQVGILRDKFDVLSIENSRYKKITSENSAKLDELVPAKLELQEHRYKLLEEIVEMRRNYEMDIANLKVNLSRACETQLLECKGKAWCPVCKKAAKYFCCPVNYCSIDCKIKDLKPKFIPHE